MLAPEISVMLLNYNGGRNVLRSINSVLRSKISAPMEVILIDNGSTDGSVENAKRSFSRLKIVKLGKNYGTAAYTKAQSHVRGKYIFFTSDDKILDQHCLARLYNELKKDHQIGQAAPLLLDYKTHAIDASGTWISPWFYAGKSMQKPSQNITEVPYFGMGLISLEALQKAGGYLYDTRYFLYSEDVDLGLRLNKAGFKVVLVSDAVAYHMGDVAAQIWPREYLYYLSERNILRTFFKHHHNVTLATLILPVLVARIVKIVFDLARLRFSIAVGRARGTWAALWEWVYGKWKTGA